MCEVKGAHIMGKQPDILEDFGGECAYLHCFTDAPAPTCSSLPCLCARSTVGSKLKRVHKKEREVWGMVYYALNIK